MLITISVRGLSRLRPGFWFRGVNADGPSLLCLFLIALSLPMLGSAQTQHSEVWGEKGEKWDRNGLLRDFTNAGYMEGKEPIPLWPVGVNVKQFGAKGDGKHDDTQAFRAAIAACPLRHAILIPKGRYRITEQIRLEPDDKSHFVFRGEDRFESVIFFPLYLTEIYGIPFGKKHRASNPLNEGFFRFSGGTHRSFENLSFEFREQPNGSHWEFIGADAIYFNVVENNWIRNVYIRNADQAIYLWGGNTKNISVLNVIEAREPVFGATRPARQTASVGDSADPPGADG